MVQDLILASRSAIRAELLRAAGLAPLLVTADIDERALEDGWAASGLPPAQVAVALAEAKAQDVSRRAPDALVIGADQTMALGPERFHKAAGRDEARERLSRLAGQTHHLHSGYALVRGGTVIASGVSSAALTMRSFDDAFLDGYLDRAGDDVLSSVGCYQLEGLGVTLFSAIEGDYFTILGLPMLPLLADLRSAGIHGI